MKPFEYKQHDFRTPPKFLTPLTDRVVVAGYSAALNCAVRGEPKVRGRVRDPGGGPHPDGADRGVCSLPTVSPLL